MEPIERARAVGQPTVDILRRMGGLTSRAMGVTLRTASVASELANQLSGRPHIADRLKAEEPKNEVRVAGQYLDIGQRIGSHVMVLFGQRKMTQTVHNAILNPNIPDPVADDVADTIENQPFDIAEVNPFAARTIRAHNKRASYRRFLGG